MIRCLGRFQARRYPEPRRGESRLDRGCEFGEGEGRNCLHVVRAYGADSGVGQALVWKGGLWK